MLLILNLSNWLTFVLLILNFSIWLTFVLLILKFSTFVLLILNLSADLFPYVFNLLNLDKLSQLSDPNDEKHLYLLKINIFYVDLFKLITNHPPLTTSPNLVIFHFQRTCQKTSPSLTRTAWFNVRD